MIEFKNISVSFKQDKQIFAAVNDANFKIKKGEIFGIAGSSGVPAKAPCFAPLIYYKLCRPDKYLSTGRMLPIIKKLNYAFSAAISG
jgi:ABC-type ATPase involved in cell division